MAATYTPSPNLVHSFQLLDSPRWKAWNAVRERADNGEAITEGEALDVVYEALGDLMDEVADLADMCRRREEALFANGITVGPSPSLTDEAR